MHTRLILAAAAAIAAASLIPSICAAQAPILNSPQDARSYGLAGSGAADVTDPSTVLNNPAIAHCRSRTDGDHPRGKIREVGGRGEVA